jgi:HPt (histidine-containing phosphotransfer) domain-containing protein
MTANAMASDRDDCLAAGMNDHVGKPFDLDHLVAVLRRQVGLAAALPAAADKTQDADAALPTTVRLAAEQAQVDMAAALNRLGGKTSVYQRMLRGFVKDLADMPAELRAHVRRGDAKQASNLLHTLKGLAATVGATALSSAAAQGERALLGAIVQGAIGPGEIGQGTSGLETAAPAFELVCHAIAAAQPQLGALLRALSDASGEAVSLHTAAANSQQSVLGPAGSSWGDCKALPSVTPHGAAALPDTLDLSTALTSLAALLRDADMAATDAAIDLQARWGDTLGAPGQVMDEAIEALDFERASSLCQTLIDDLKVAFPA